MDAGTEAVMSQIDSALSSAEELLAAGDTNLEQGPEGAAVRARCVAVLERLAPGGSSYRRMVTGTEEAASYWDHKEVIKSAVGSLQALREDLSAGYMATLSALIHGETFADFLDMATHLLDEGYKDAAAVIGGRALEGHLRVLAEKAGIPTTSPADGRPLKAERLNADLRAANAYGKGDQKSVTAWLDLRNDAAHGLYEKYEPGQVGLMTSGVRDFIRRLPA